MALRAVWEPTMERNQRPPVSGSRAKASVVAENPAAVMVWRSGPAPGGAPASAMSCIVVIACLPLDWWCGGRKPARGPRGPGPAVGGAAPVRA